MFLKMTRLILLSLPYSRSVGYRPNPKYNKYLYCIRNCCGCCRQFSYNMSLIKLTNNLLPSLNLFKHIHKSSKLMSDTLDEDIAVTDDLVFSRSISRGCEIEEYSEQFRNTLYPDSNDTIINQLKTCNSVIQLLHIVNNNLSSLTVEHNCQFILVLWSLVEAQNKAIKRNEISGPFNEKLDHNFGNDVIRPTYNLRLTIFNSLNSIARDVDRLTPEALACSVLYSHRLGINLRNPSIQILLLKISELIKSEDVKVFTASAHSRLTLAFVECEELWSKLFIIRTLPLIYKYFDTCDNADDFKALTISMLSTLPYLRETLLLQYEALTEDLLRNGTLTKKHTSAIIKALSLLCHIYIKPSARFMMYKLFHMLNGEINKLFLPHINDIQKIVSLHLEPRNTIIELAKFKKDFSLDLMSDLEITPQHLPMLTLPLRPKSALVLKELIRDIDNWDNMLLIQHHLTTAHLETCRLFWNKIVSMLQSDDHLVDCLTLQLLCLRYMNFISRMGSYRHKPFERHMLNKITSELVRGSAGHQPKVFALLAAFVLSFDIHTYTTTSLVTDIVPRLLPMIGQFDVLSILTLSRGLKQGLASHGNRHLHFYLQLKSALDVRIRDLLESEDGKSISTLNMICRSCINSKGSSENNLLWDIFSRFKEVDWSQLTSRSLRNLIYNFNITGSLVPSSVDHMVDYCLQNRQYITADTISKLTYMCYNLGYMPSAHVQSFCAVTADLVTRDHNSLSGLTLLQVAQALAFFNQLPPSIIHIIFNVRFLETLDEEIKNCFSKDKYPLRVRKNLMELNRSVCLDYPEADVPWFHSKFCEEQLAVGQLEVRAKSLIHIDVLNTLVTLLGDSSLISTNTVTPYGYNIDFQLNLDAALNPVPSKGKQTIVHKVALLLRYEKNFTTCERRLKGYHQMKQRHLEILGYRVLSLSDTLWNAMFMTEPKIKPDYLRNLIWHSLQEK